MAKSDKMKSKYTNETGKYYLLPMMMTHWAAHRYRPEPKACTSGVGNREASQRTPTGRSPATDNRNSVLIKAVRGFL